MNDTPRYRIKFRSTRFVEDCLECGCAIGSWSRHEKVLTCSDGELAELRSQAEFYADPDAVDCGSGLRRSAASVVRTLRGAL